MYHNNAGGRGDWKLGLFRTDSESDIIQVASVLQGRGVFQNVPATRRQGVEAGVNYQTQQYLLYANYAMVDATYQFTGLLASPNNPSANANGDILVTPGKQIPGIPLHQIKGEQKCHDRHDRGDRRDDVLKREQRDRGARATAT